MFSFIVSVIYLVSLFESSFAHSVVAEYKHLDKKVMEILFKLSSLEEWEEMLKIMEYYTMKLMNFGLRISQELETDKKLVTKIVKNGQPRFMNATLNEELLTFIPREKIDDFYNLKNELLRVWEAFLKISKNMKWVKKTRKPYIVQGAFHGRRLGKRKGAKNPYIPNTSNQENKPLKLDSGELDKKSSIFSNSLSESEYN